MRMSYWTEGTKIGSGRYTIESPPRVGKDGTTVTYTAWDDKAKKRVAIETPNPEIVDQDFFESIQTGFAREAVKLATCQHPNIIRVQENGLFKENDLWCLALEYLEGGTLEKPASVCLEVSEALGYIRQIGEALTMLHEKGMVHGDVRPINIHLRGSSREAVLTNFSLAREVESEWTRTRPERSRSYAPLEGMTGKPTPRSDLYMLGATLYSFLTGREPVDALQREEGVKLNFTLLTDGVELNDGLRDAIRAAMALKESDRPDSVTAWLQSLGVGVTGKVGKAKKAKKGDIAYNTEVLKLITQVFVAVTAIVGLIVGLVKVQEVQPSNESSSQTRSEKK